MDNSKADQSMPFQFVLISGGLNPEFFKDNTNEKKILILFQVSSKEAEFLQKILPGLYKNLQENPQTLLTKYYGMFAYQVQIDINHSFLFHLRRINKMPL